MIETLRNLASGFKDSSKQLGLLVAKGVAKLGISLEMFGSASKGAGSSFVTQKTLLKTGLATERLMKSMSKVLQHKKVQRSVAVIYADVYAFYGRYLNKMADQFERITADKELQKEFVELQNSVEEVGESFKTLVGELKASIDDVMNNVDEDVKEKSDSVDKEIAVLVTELENNTPFINL